MFFICSSFVISSDFRQIAPFLLDKANLNLNLFYHETTSRTHTQCSRSCLKISYIKIVLKAHRVQPTHHAIIQESYIQKKNSQITVPLVLFFFFHFLLTLSYVSLLNRSYQVVHNNHRVLSF